jgi:hypothetical protein
MLSCVTDVRREQAKRYGLATILLFCIFGFLCGAKSYKTLCSFIEERFALLQAAFPSKMKRAPAPSRRGSDRPFLGYRGRAGTASP